MTGSHLSTRTILILGITFAVLSVLPSYTYIFDKNWSLMHGFPFGWLSVCMAYMGTFFHEIGHSLFAWFYGYFSLPSFDFQHGGGMAYYFGEPKIPILLIVWGALIYGFYLFREYKDLQLLMVFLLILNILFAFNEYHRAIIAFMGPGFKCLIGSFFLYRALFDLAPRGDFERFLNAFFGFGMIFDVFVNGYSLLKDDVSRILYYQQKGGHGTGDFDKIVDQVSFLAFDDVIHIWLTFNLICFATPLILKMREQFYFMRNDWH